MRGRNHSQKWGFCPIRDSQVLTPVILKLAQAHQDSTTSTYYLVCQKNVTERSSTYRMPVDKKVFEGEND